MASLDANEEALSVDRNCYICKKDFRELHFFYDSMCAACAQLNYTKREQSADLRGRVALITGARVKIGYQAGILLKSKVQIVNPLLILAMESNVT